MSGLYLGGLVSGSNTADMIRKIMQLEQVRLQNRQTDKSQLQAKQKAWRDVRAQLSTLQSKLDTLRYPFVYRSREVSMTDESVASATASTGASLTTYSLSVTALAQTHVVSNVGDPVTRPQTDQYAQLGVTGSFTIGLASGTAQQVDVVGTDTLHSLADKINAKNTGVSASVMKVTVDGTDEYRLVLTSSKSGVDNAVVMTDVAGSEGTLQNLGLKAADGTWSNEISQAQNAAFTLNGVAYQRATNVIDDVVSGLTFTLKKQGSTQATVSLDADKVVESVKAWIDAVNGTQELLNKLSGYNSDTKKAEVLNGDSLVRNLQRTIRSSISNVVTGLPADMDRLSLVGITTGAWGTAEYGKVTIDEAKFKEMLQKDPESMAKLFGAQRNNVALASSNATVALDGATTTAAGYDLNDVINGVTDSARFGTAGGGWQSGASPSTGAQGFTIAFDGAKTIDQITLYQPDPSDTPASTHGLKDYTLEYWDDATSTWQTLKAVTNASGVSQVVEFDAVTTTKVRLSVTATYNDHAVRITEFQVGEYNNGAAIDMYRYIRSTLETSTGALDVRDSTLTKQVERINDQIERIENQLVEREERLRMQFARMEEAMAKLRSQGSVFAMMGGGMFSQ